ncbi:MAG: IclR family transcriptional regulator [Gemmatimonadetes bacterium]|nr:IclR family transcriptional regulator [Gemmatimonadota bacterium]
MVAAPGYPGTQAVTRAVSLLKAFSDARPEWRLSDLARAARLHKATAHRLLSALEREGIVARDPSGERYRLGPEAIALGARAARATDLRAVCRAELESLAAETGETATLEVLAGGEMLILDEVLGRALIGATPSLGTRWPAHATSTGKAVLAALPDAERKAILGTRLTRCTDRTLTSPRALARDLARARRHGYAVALEELERGYVAVGAAVRDSDGRALAAVSVGGPSLRFPAARIAALGRRVTAAAARASATLGYRAGGSR